MATKSSKSLARLLVAPSVLALLVWMIVPLSVTIWFSFQRYNLLYPERSGFAGWANYASFVSNASYWHSIINTLTLVGGVLCITVIGGLIVALIIDRPMYGRRFVRMLAISPFFIMPPVAALIWKNMFMNPTNGLLAQLFRALGFQSFDFMGQAPLFSLILIVSWQWLPFSALILLTSLQSLSDDQLEAAEMDGASALQRFIFIKLPHLYRALTVVILIQTIFLLGIFGEILVTTNGGPGNASTTLTYLIYQEALLDYDAGTAAAGGIIAVILANLVALFLMRIIGKNMDA
ncbi:MAG: carbohydrate ABC transporter permease [Tropicimonas sp.]|uniref:carbohydrate ABC transporter permease n=1 Tax=Tropicimonas sp. TaxID=2067044 RepID=UPI003A841B35